MNMEGYAQLAWRMTTNPDLNILRRFGTLNNQNLLYLQAELHILELQLREKEKENAQSQEKRKQWCSRDWETLSATPNTHAGDESGWQLFLEMRAKLKEYSVDDALLQQSLISKLHKPSANGLKILNELLVDSDCSDYLLGQDKLIWSTPALKGDLITLHPGLEASHDRLSLWLAKRFLGNFHHLFGRFKKSSVDCDPVVVHYNDEDLLIPTSIISTVLSSLLPIVAVVVLYLVHSMPKRLAIIAAFTAVFSIVLVIVTTAKRSEIFAATAAFAAVQVVFISTNIPNISH